MTNTEAKKNGKGTDSQRRLSLLTAASALASLTPGEAGSDSKEQPVNVDDSSSSPTSKEKETSKGPPEEEKGSPGETKISASAETKPSPETKDDVSPSIIIPKVQQKYTAIHMNKRFPDLLREILEREDAQDMITWLPCGTAFAIHKPFDLASKILPLYFKSGQFESFVRKLNRWGFRRDARLRSQSTGAFYHENFIRDKPELMINMNNRRAVANPRGKGPKQMQMARAAAAAKAEATLRQEAIRAQTAAMLGHVGHLPHLQSGANFPHGSHGMPTQSELLQALVAQQQATMHLGLQPNEPLGMPNMSQNFVSPMNAAAARAGVSSPPTSIMGLVAGAEQDAYPPPPPLPNTTAAPSPLGLGVGTPPLLSAAQPEGNGNVNVAYLRHQEALRRTQESRALLKQIGLMEN